MKQHAVDQFWHKYLFILEESSIPVKARRCYRIHVETYMAAHPGVKLKAHLPADIDEYLIAKGRLTSLPEWRFRQIADALPLLLCELIQTD